MWWILGAWIGYQFIGLIVALIMTGPYRRQATVSEWALLIVVWPYLIYSAFSEWRANRKEKSRLRPFEDYLSTLPDDDKDDIEARLRHWTRRDWNDE